MNLQGCHQFFSQCRYNFSAVLTGSISKGRLYMSMFFTKANILLILVSLCGWHAYIQGQKAGLSALDQDNTQGSKPQFGGFFRPISRCVLDPYLADITCCVSLRKLAPDSVSVFSVQYDSSCRSGLFDCSFACQDISRADFNE